MSFFSDELVSMTTGCRAVRGSLRIRRRTSRPSTLGSLMSRRITFGEIAPAKIASRAAAPSRTTSMRLARLCRRRARSVSFSSYLLSSTSRMSTGPSAGNRRLSDGEEEGRSLAGLAFGPDPPAVPLDDPLHDRQADARPLELVGAVQPLEDA